MADKKTELMAQFYADCQQKGYTDMTDDTQSLKAKVIATDLKLNYGNIKAFYEKSKTCYEQVQAEKTEAERLKAIQQQKDAQERTRRQVNGELLVTLSDRAYESDETTSVRVYIRPDNSVYSTVNNGSKIEGVPQISVKQGGALLLTYHPSQAVYTGATVGGITTGGVHYTQSGYTASKTHSGKGDIEISVGGRPFTLRLVKMSGYTCELFKRDGQFKSLVNKEQINCYVESDKANLYYESIKTGRLDHQTMMNALSMAADEQRLSYAMCERITHLLGRVVHGQFPPSDEQIYDSAKALENASTSADLNRAVELYSSISDYKDAAIRIQAVARKYEDVLQIEKEQAILEREARTKKNAKIAAIVVPILVVLIVAAVIVSNSVKKSNDYEFALSLVESGQYGDAIEHFAALGDYKDSAEQIHIATYKDGLRLLEDGQYDKAVEVFESIREYKDSEEILVELLELIELEEQESKYQKALQLLANSSYDNNVKAYLILQNLGEYKDAANILPSFEYVIQGNVPDDVLVYNSRDCYEGTSFPKLEFYLGKAIPVQTYQWEFGIEYYYENEYIGATDYRDSDGFLFRYGFTRKSAKTSGTVRYIFFDDMGNALKTSLISSSGGWSTVVSIIPSENVQVFLDANGWTLN